MDKNETMIAIGTMATTQKNAALGSSYVLSSMVVFSDSSYFIIGAIGAVVSSMSHHYDITQERTLAKINNILFSRSIPLEIIKSFLIGFLFTVACFIFLNQAGNAAIKHYVGINVVVQLLPSFWMIVTLYLSTKSIAIYNKFSLKVGGV